MKGKYMVIVVMCFIFGGYFILSSAVRMQSIIAIGGLPDDAFFDRNITGTDSGPGPNESRIFMMAQGGLPPFGAGTAFMDIAAGVMFIIAGLSVFRLVREDDIKVIRGELTDSMLLPEEKLIIAQLRKSGGEMTQKEITQSTGLSKVRIHRVLAKLEGKKIVRRHPYGMTKKIVLEKNQ
jgi:uncharacterized membrane protein